MLCTTFLGRRAASIENDLLRVTVLEDGGHIAEILHKKSGVNPLWIPPWAAQQDPDCGTGDDAALLAGIAGHNLCLDVFGGPSPDEAEAGLGVHGEASVLWYQIEGRGTALITRVQMPLAGLRFKRSLHLEDESVLIRESVENLSATDRPIAWTQHVTLGPPFLAKGATTFRSSATRSKVFETAFGAHDYLAVGSEFEWPLAPRTDGGEADLRVFNDAPASSAFTTHLMDRTREDSFFAAHSNGLLFGYVWKSADFPWMGIWEENLSRTQAPWNGNTIARGMEFGVSPMPETRRAMIDRGRLFDVPTYRWLPAKARLEVAYRAVAFEVEAIEDLA
jgi:hypothetical protein